MNFLSAFPVHVFFNENLVERNFFGCFRIAKNYHINPLAEELDDERKKITEVLDSVTERWADEFLIWVSPAKWLNSVFLGS